MEKSKIIKKYKKSLETCERYVNKGELSTVSDLWNKRVEHIKNILDLLENNTLTHEKFMKLDPRDKWDTHKYFDGKVIWLCVCGEEIGDPESVVIGNLMCGHCGFELTRRTGGGQNNPFNWTFEYNIKELRKQKLKQIGNENEMERTI